MRFGRDTVITITNRWIEYILGETGTQTRKHNTTEYSNQRQTGGSITWPYMVFSSPVSTLFFFHFLYSW